MNEHDAHKQNQAAQNDARQRGGRAGRTQMLGKRFLESHTEELLKHVPIACEICEMLLIVELCREI